MAAPLFPLGRLCATPGALDALAAAETPPSELLVRHASGDWGEIPPEDVRENERSLKYGWRVMSSYLVGDETIWVLTEADRSATTLMLPREY